jgi:hypothetical protein
MALRNVAKTYTFEEQRQEINLISADLGDISTLTGLATNVVSTLNNIIGGTQVFTNVTTSGDVTIQGGDINLDSNATNINIKDNVANALLIKEGANSYLSIDTTNGSEAVTIHKDTFIGGDLTVDGDITFRAGQGSSGSITLGDGNTDNVVFGADVNSNIIPNTTNAYDLGSSSQKWKDLYLSGNATIDTITNAKVAIQDNTSSAYVVSEGANPYLTLNTTNGSESITLHKNTLVEGNLTVNGDITFRAGDTTNGTITFGDLNTDNIVFNADLNSNIIPNTDNTFDLGSSSQKWRDIHVGRDANVDTLKTTKISLSDNLASAISVFEGSNEYIKVTTTNGSEATSFSTGKVVVNTSLEANTIRSAGAAEITVDTDINVTQSLSVKGVNVFEHLGHHYYVSSRGTDSIATSGVGAREFPGRTPQTAFATLKYALSQAVSGDTITVGPGIFVEEFPLTVPQGVTIKGTGLRSTKIVPTTSTKDLDCFLLNGETTVEDLTIADMFYNATNDTGYAFRLATGANSPLRSPYVQRVTVLNRGSVTTSTDPYGYAANDAGRGALIDGSVVNASTIQAAILFNETTFIVPNAIGVKMTNGARAEYLNCFTYFAEIGVLAVSGSTGFAGAGKTKLRFDGLGSFTPAAGNTVKYYDVDGTTVLAEGTVSSYNNGVLLLTNKGTGTFVTAESRPGKIATANGGITLSTTQKKFGTSSAVFDGIDNYLTYSNSTDFGFGTSDFTIEAFIYLNNTTGTKSVLDHRTSGTEFSPTVYIDGSTLKYFTNGADRISGGTLVTNTWHHIAVSRQGTSTKLWLDGVQIGSTYTDSNDYGGSKPLRIGANVSGIIPFNGYIDEVRITKGFARYTGTYTVPTAEFSSDINTSLLLHLNGTNGSTNFTDDAVGTQDIRFFNGATQIGTATAVTLADYQQFGAEMRSIGCASEFGEKGIVADGVGTDIQLISYTFNYVGTGGDFSQDDTLVIQANEVIELNGGNVSYVSVDQKGDFRVGDIFYVDQENGNINFGNQNFSISSASSISVTDGSSSTVINPTSINVGNFEFSGNTISTLSGDISIVPSGGDTNITGNLGVSGNLTVDGDITFRAGSGTGGTITFGDLNTDNIVFNADLNSHIIPNTNNTYDVGSSSQQWRDLYVARDANINTLKTSKLSISDNLATAFSIDEGANTYFKITTTNGSEKIYFYKDLEVTGAVVLTGNITAPNIGDITTLSNLITNDTSLVTAINELQGDIGNIATLAAGITQRNSVVEAINNVYAAIQTTNVTFDDIIPFVLALG